MVRFGGIPGGGGRLAHHEGPAAARGHEDRTRSVGPLLAPAQPILTRSARLSPTRSSSRPDSEAAYVVDAHHAELVRTATATVPQVMLQLDVSKQRTYAILKTVPSAAVEEVPTVGRGLVRGPHCDPWVEPDERGPVKPRRPG